MSFTRKKLFMWRACCNKGKHSHFCFYGISFCLRMQYTVQGAYSIQNFLPTIGLYMMFCVILRGWRVAAVHGGIFEADRNKAVVSFKKGSSSVLVSSL